MSFDAAFLSLMGDTVVIRSLASVDGYGQPTYSTAGSTYSGRYVRKQELVRTFEGTEDLAQATVYIASTSTFAPSAKITVNGSTVGPLMALSAYPDEDGVHHLKASFG